MGFHSGSSLCVLGRLEEDRAFTAFAPPTDRCVTVQPDACATYRDDIQDAEEAVDTVSWKHFLHHTFFAILKKKKRKKKKTCMSECAFSETKQMRSRLIAVCSLFSTEIIQVTR